jgi:hypothetical protein
MKCSMSASRAVDDVLDQRPVDHRQHLLRHRLGRGQEARAEAGDRKNSFAYLPHCALLLRSLGLQEARFDASMSRPGRLGKSERRNR